MRDWVHTGTCCHAGGPKAVVQQKANLSRYPINSSAGPPPHWRWAAQWATWDDVASIMAVTPQRHGCRLLLISRFDTGMISGRFVARCAQGAWTRRHCLCQSAISLARWATLAHGVSLPSATASDQHPRCMDAGAGRARAKCGRQTLPGHDSRDNPGSRSMKRRLRRRLQLKQAGRR